MKHRLTDIYADLALSLVILLVVALAAVVVARRAMGASLSDIICPDGDLVTCWLRERPDTPNRRIPLVLPTPDGGSK